MITIITGSVHSGKSSRLVNIYKTKSGDGFYNIRRYKNNYYIGQDLIRLSSGSGMPFTRVTGQIPAGWNEAYHYRNYSFSKDGLLFAAAIIEEMIELRQTGYIDEIGPLELMGKGLYPYIEKLLKRDIDLYLAVRETCLFDVINKIISTDKADMDLGY